jgi:hypothetical protein
MPVIDDYILTVRQHGVGGYPGDLITMLAPINLWGAGEDDGTSAALPIGFSFDAFGTFFNFVTVNTNGWLVFGSTSTGMGSGYQNASATWGVNGASNTYTIAVPWWDDLKTSLNAGYVQYETQGVPPNRAFICEWSCQCNYNQPIGAQDKITFQVVLRENGDKIEYRYGPMVTYGVPARGSYSASCGARVDTTGGVPNNVRGFLGAGYVNGGNNTIIGTTAVAINAIGSVIQYPGDPGNTDQGFAYDFLFSPPAVINSITPNIGVIGGGTPVTIGGDGFTGTTGVDIGGNPATAVVVAGPTSITCVTPAGVAGAVDVDVTTPSGTITGTNLFVYGPPLLPPNPTGIVPPSGTSIGGTPVTITGTDFLDGATFTLDGVAANGVLFISPTSLTGVTPPGAIGVVDLVVTNPTIQSGTLPASYTYTLGLPTITSLSSLMGDVVGGLHITITGTNLTPTTTVSFGLAGPATSTFINSTTMTCSLPAYVLPGPTPPFIDTVDCTVTSAAGTSNIIVFTYVMPATVTLPTSPNTGPVSGGTFLTITGVNFDGTAPGGTTMRLFPTFPPFISSYLIPNPVNVINSTTATGTTPVLAPGPGLYAMIVVQNGYQQYTGMVFTAVAPPPSGGGSVLKSMGGGFLSSPFTLTP